MKKSLIALLVAGATICLTACQTGQGSSNKTPQFDVVPTTFDHYYSNQISLADMNYGNIEGKGFINDRIEHTIKVVDGVEKVGLKYVTDGDTAVFYTSGQEDRYTIPDGVNARNYFTVRFLGVDTPESTSSIEPWGKKASDYGKSLLENAEGIVLDAMPIDVTSYSEDIEESYKANVRIDNNGTRWLALVWYCPEGKDPSNYENYRSYQLDVIEEGYSTYNGGLGDEIDGNVRYVYNADKEKEPILYSTYADSLGSMTLNDIFFEASQRTKSLNQRFSGSEQDPDYYYSSDPVKISITEAIEDTKFAELTKKNTYVELTGVITEFVGVNFYMQDAQGTPLYVYMGLDGKSVLSDFSVGDTLKVRGRLSTYGGQKQLTDIHYNKTTFVKVAEDDPEHIEWNRDSAIIDITPSDYQTLAQLKELEGKLVRTTLNIEHRGNVSKDLSYTLYATETVKELADADYQYDSMSIRINGKLSPTYTVAEGDAFVDKKVEVVGIMGLYFEEDLTQDVSYPSYQIVPGNRPTEVIYDENGIPVDVINGTDIKVLN